MVALPTECEEASSVICRISRTTKENRSSVGDNSGPGVGVTLAGRMKCSSGWDGSTETYPAAGLAKVSLASYRTPDLRQIQLSLYFVGGLCVCPHIILFAPLRRRLPSLVVGTNSRCPVIQPSSPQFKPGSEHLKNLELSVDKTLRHPSWWLPVPAMFSMAGGIIIFQHNGGFEIGSAGDCYK